MPHGDSKSKGWSRRLRSAEARVRSWPADLGQARAEQERLRCYVSCRDEFSGPDLVAGVDVGYDRERNIAVAGLAVLSVQDLSLVDTAVGREPIRFPYVPGYLSFREIPAVVTAMRELSATPDMLLCDGQGIAHPRGLGLASHLGVLLDTPSVGVAKSKLVGIHDSVGEEKGDWVPLRHKGDVVGAVLRTRSRVKPVFVSCGHKVGLTSSMEIVLRLTEKYRLPETTRKADALARSATASG